MSGVGRILIFMGLAITVFAILYLVLGYTGVPRGRVIGDLEYHSKNVHVYFPLAICLIISVVLSLVFWIANRR